MRPSRDQLWYPSVNEFFKIGYRTGWRGPVWVRVAPTAEDYLWEWVWLHTDRKRNLAQRYACETLNHILVTGLP